MGPRASAPVWDCLEKNAPASENSFSLSVSLSSFLCLTHFLSCARQTLASTKSRSSFFVKIDEKIKLEDCPSDDDDDYELSFFETSTYLVVALSSPNYKFICMAQDPGWIGPWKDYQC